MTSVFKSLDKWELLDYGIGKRYVDAKVSDIPVTTPAGKLFLGYCKSLTLARTKGEGFYLYGPNGTGKTHLLTIALKWAASLRYSVRFVTSDELLRVFAGDAETTQRVGTLEKLQGVDFLGVDDICKEYHGSQFFFSRFGSFIRNRYANMRPVLYTSNADIAAFSKLFGDSSSSLVLATSLLIELKGKNYRAEKPVVAEEYFVK